VASGVVISYPWASNLVYRAVGEAPPPPTPPAGAEPAAGRPRAPGAGRTAEPAAAPASLAPLVARAEQRLPGWRSLVLTLPKSAAEPVSFTVDHGTGGQPQARAQLTLDQATGQETRWQPFDAGSRGRQLRSILRFAHTGEVLGIPGQTLAGLVSLGAVVLVWTGLALSWRRLRAWRNRRRLRTGFAPRSSPIVERESAA
jgi:uncharacterized iron-regulated membrane protein